MKNRLNNSGFTLIEIVIVMMVFSVLYSVVTLNLLSVKQRSSVNSQLQLLISDMKSAQLEAMTGKNNASQQAVGVGLYFESGRYTVFKGNSYDPSDPDNLIVENQDNISLSASFPSSTLVFSRLNGEVNGFDPSGNFIDVTNLNDGETKRIILNRLGTVIQIQ